jgi:hypothetical protein
MSDVACEEIYQNDQSWIKDYIMHGFQEWIKPPPQRSHAPIFDRIYCSPKHIINRFIRWASFSSASDKLAVNGQKQ